MWTGGGVFMRVAKIWLAMVVLVGAMGFAPILGAQEVGAPPTPPKVATVEVTPNGTKAKVGDKLQFAAGGKDAAGNKLDLKPMMWVATPPDAAGADKDGNVVFYTPGEITV